MMCCTRSASTAYWMTERQFKSVCTTTFATLRWTKSSPGKRPTISFAGTRLSAQPIQRYCGDCWCDSRLKKFASRCVIDDAHLRLFSKRLFRIRIEDLWRENIETQT